jgi:hypothetical protein
MTRKRLMSPALVGFGSLLSVVLGIVLYAPAVHAGGQTVDGTVLLAANGGGVARREWTASAGAINGVNGYVFAVDPTSIGTYFNLTPASSSTGTGTLFIAFYTDMVNGITCDSFGGTPTGAAGAVCGAYGIVYLDPGASVTFHYVSGLPAPAPPPFVSSSFTFSAPIALAPAAGQTTGNIGEPSVDVDPGNGNIYVSAPTGVPCGLNTTDECVAFWRSTDAGKTFVQPAPGAFHHPIGGGDSDVIHDGTGNVLVADLRTLTSAGVFRSIDQGNTWTSTTTAPCNDREWIAWGGWHTATGPGTIYETNNAGACQAGLLSFYRSLDDGLTFLPTGFVASDLRQFGYMVDTTQNSIEAKLAIDPMTGAIYVAWATAAIQDGTNASLRLVLVGKSTDGGFTWTNKLVYSGPPGTSVGNLFPVAAVDHSGNVYVAFSTQLPGQNYGVYLVSSHDAGATWSSANRVNPAAQTAIFPAIAAGDRGRVDLIWIGANGVTSPNDPSAQWNIYFAQSRKAYASSPLWSNGQISTSVMHRGDICNQGLNCNIFGGNRNLLDFISVAIDGHGKANAVWTDDASQSPKAVMFSKQTGGPTTGKQPPIA